MKNNVSTLALKICSVCKIDLQNKQFIQCAECDLKEFCIACFCSTENNTNDCKTHSYRVIPKLQSNKTQGNWEAFEELKIIEIFAQKGYGNWEEFSLLIKSKSGKEIEEFFSCYLVPFLHGKKTIQNFVPMQQRINEEINDFINKANVLREQRGFNKSTFLGEHLGFMPLRQELEFEHENEAEILLSEIVNKKEDTEEDEQLKFNLLELYNRWIKEWIKRREFLIGRNKLDLEQTLQEFSQMSQMEKEIRFDLMKVERFFTKEEFEDFQSLVIQDAELGLAIEQLKVVKESGFENLDQFREFIKEQSDFKSLNHNLDEINLEEMKSWRKGNRLLFAPEIKESENNPMSILYGDDGKRIAHLESALCEEIQVVYQNYQKIKETLIYYNLQEGEVNKEKFLKQKMNKIYQENKDSHQRKIFYKIFDFLKAQHLIIEAE